MAVTLKITFCSSGRTRAMRFNQKMSMDEVYRDILEKEPDEGGPDHGLMLAADPKTGRTRKWLAPEKTLLFFNIGSGEELLLKKKHRMMNVELGDGTRRTLMMDDSLPVQELAERIGTKLALRNPEEFSLRWKEEDSASNDEKKKKKHLQRKKNKTDTDEDLGRWLNPGQELGEQGVPENAVLLLEKRFFVEDRNVDTSDPTQLHLIYVQCVRDVMTGVHPVTGVEASQFAAIQCQIIWGNYDPQKHTKSFLKGEHRLDRVLPFRYRRQKKIIGDILKEWPPLINTSSLNAKYKYLQLCRTLKTYGVTFYPVKWKAPGKRRISSIRFGITLEDFICVDPDKGYIIEEHPLEHLKQWAHGPNSITLNFGDYRDEYMSLQTTQGEAISHQISGYIDILTRRRREGSVVVPQYEGEVAENEQVAVPVGHSVTSVTTTTFSGGVTEGATEGVIAGGAHIPGVSPRTSAMLGQVQTLAEMEDGILLLLNDLLTPIPIGSEGTMTANQLRDELGRHNISLAAAAAGLIKDARDGATQGVLDGHAQALGLNLAQLIGAARLSAAALGDDVSLLDGGKAVADALKRLLNAAGDVAHEPTVANKEILLEAAVLFRATASALKATAVDRLSEETPKNLLLESARAVADATRDLLNSSMTAASSWAGKYTTLGAQEQDEPSMPLLVQSAKMLGDACNNLLNATVQYHSEKMLAKRASGDATPGGAAERTVYRKDPAWSNGLISAAQAVGVTTQDLVHTAIGLVKRDKNYDEEMLLASAKQVDAAAARLLAASCARSGPLSQAHMRLVEASKAIMAAVKALVDAARQLGERAAEVGRKGIKPHDSDNAVLARMEHIEAKAEVFRLERKLQLARQAYDLLNKEKYAKDL